MKKILSMITCMMLCIMLVMPVSAAGMPQTEETEKTMQDSPSLLASTNYFTGSTVKLNSLNGTSSTISTISSGSVLGTNPKVTSVKLNVTVSSGSAPFYLYVEDPNGNVDYTTVSRSGSVSFSSFNGVRPNGKWKVYIVTKGTVSTATARMTVNYSY